MTAWAGSCQSAACSSINWSSSFLTLDPAVVWRKESRRQVSRRVIWPGVSVSRSLPMWVKTWNRHSTSFSEARVRPPVRVVIQHSASKLSKTSLGGIPSYLVRSCSCLLFSSPYISFKKHMKAAHRPGELAGDRRSEPRSWNHS